MKNKEVPYFIQVRGCINCSHSATYKKKTGHDYGFDHEIVAGCLIRGCLNNGHTLDNPYYDPEEIVRLANEIGTKEAKENTRKICLGLESQYSSFYQKENISVRTILEKLEP